jgi:hypothetical protein
VTAPRPTCRKSSAIGSATKLQAGVSRSLRTAKPMHDVNRMWVIGVLLQGSSRELNDFWKQVGFPTITSCKAILLWWDASNGRTVNDTLDRPVSWVEINPDIAEQMRFAKHLKEQVPHLPEVRFHKDWATAMRPTELVKNVRLHT